MWWSTVARGLVLALLLYISSDLIGSFFNDANVSYTTRLIALAFIVYSFVNPVLIVEATRFFRFEKIFILEFSESLMYFLASLVFAFVFEDFRALVLGFIVAGATKLVVSYILRPYLPGLSYSILWLKRMFSFGVWVNLTFVLNFLLMYMDRTLVGKLAGQTSLGYYSNAQRFALQAPPQITAMLSRVLFPYFVGASGKDSERVYVIYLRTVMVIASLFFAPMFFLNREVIDLFLGEGWEYSAEILRPLSVAGLLAMVSNTVSPISQGKGMPRLDVFRLIVIPVVFLVAALFDIRNGVWIAWSLALGYASSIPISMWGVRICGVSAGGILRSFLPFLMAFALSSPLYLLHRALPALLLPILTSVFDILFFGAYAPLLFLRVKVPRG